MSRYVWSTAKASSWTGPTSAAFVKSAEAANSGVVGTGPGRSGPALRSPGASAEGGGPAAALAPAASRRRLSPPPLLELLVMLQMMLKWLG